MRADFLQQEPWTQDEACPRRRTAIEEEQSKIYHFLNRILELSVPQLNATHNKRARDGLLELLRYLDFDA